MVIMVSHAGHVRAQVATVEQASTGAAPKVEGPVVVVTGASRGIGKAIALSLGKAGCKVGQSVLDSPQSIVQNSSFLVLLIMDELMLPHAGPC